MALVPSLLLVLAAKLPRHTTRSLACHAIVGPPGPSTAEYLSPRTVHSGIFGPPRTVRGAVSGPPSPPTVPPTLVSKARSFLLELHVVALAVMSPIKVAHSY